MIFKKMADADQEKLKNQNVSGTFLQKTF